MFLFTFRVHFKENVIGNIVILFFFYPKYIWKYCYKDLCRKRDLKKIYEIEML